MLNPADGWQAGGIKKGDLVSLEVKEMKDTNSPYCKLAWKNNTQYTKVLRMGNSR